MADALLAGPATAEGYAERAAVALGRKSGWIAPFSRRVFQRFGSELTHPQRRSLIQFIQADAGYRQAWTAPVKPRIRHHFLDAPPMAPRRGALTRCALPALPTPGDLAAWLEIGVSELEWLADPRGMIDSAEGPLCHYHYRWVPKRQGDYRLMEVPKPRLRAIQRKILREILDPVPAHGAAHGFRRDHSCLTYVQPHVGKLVVLRVDLRNFFPSISAGRVNALFTTLGYPDAAARRLTGLCTNRVPMRILLNIPDARPRFRLPWAERRQLADPHLPQGAPTSPALANLCALHLDLRLAALADTLGGTYTRYADDLAFSGDEEMRRHAEKLSTLVAAIALEEGFEVNYRKTRVMHRSGRQILTGIVVNEKTNIRRGEYDSLKAILHNCLRHGPDSQNRLGHRDFRAHLLGRIGHVSSLNPDRGTRLQRLFEVIEWRP
ncbi:MAG TPA: reverse transcriptase family protein [Burkholderiales bacterium]